MLTFDGTEMKYCVQGNICPPFVFTPLAFIAEAN